jgi:hypothetical protein
LSVWFAHYPADEREALRKRLFDGDDGKAQNADRRHQPRTPRELLRQARDRVRGAPATPAGPILDALLPWLREQAAEEVADQQRTYGFRGLPSLEIPTGD